MFPHQYSESEDFRDHLDFFAPDYFSEYNQISLTRIDEVLKKVLHCHNHPLYAQDILSLKSYNKNNSYIVDRKREGFRVWFVHEFEVWLKLSLSLQDPYAELFLWSVLCQKIKLQEFFLSRCDSPLLMAEFAAIFYNRLSEYYRSGTGQDRLLDMKEKYVDVIMEVKYPSNNLTYVMMKYVFIDS